MLAQFCYSCVDVCQRSGNRFLIFLKRCIRSPYGRTGYPCYIGEFLTLYLSVGTCRVALHGAVIVVKLIVDDFSTREVKKGEKVALKTGEICHNK